MADNIKKMVYPEADRMVDVLKQATSQLQDTITQMEGIATALEGGALLGTAGEAMSNGIRKQLVGAINRLIEGLDDGARYVAMEREDMMQAEKQSAKLF